MEASHQTVAASRLRDTLGGVAQAQVDGDNLSILLVSFFEPRVEDEQLDEYDCWKQGAVDKANAVLDAIHAHYAPHIAELEARAEKAEAERDAAAAVLRVAEMDLRSVRLSLETSRQAAGAYLARIKTAEAEITRLRIAGTFNEGVEAAAKVCEERGRRATAFGRCIGQIPLTHQIIESEAEGQAAAIRSLRRPDEGGK